MNSDHSLGIIVLLGIVALALFGGARNSTPLLPSTSSQPVSAVQEQSNIQNEIRNTQVKTEELKKQIQIEQDKKTYSPYRDVVGLDYISRSDDPSKEHLAIRVSYNATGTIPVTGWVLKSKSSGVSVSIPKGTYLYFAGIVNSEENIVLLPNETLYIITGISPNGASFKLNKCSGYLEQFQTFTPYLGNNCPAPRTEDLSSIPKTSNNDACLDHINSMPSCRIQTTNVPSNWSYECMNFIYNQVNYPSCVSSHRNDSDFYGKEWRVYLKRSEKIWKDRYEHVTLYDNNGKIVDEITY